MCTCLYIVCHIYFFNHFLYFAAFSPTINAVVVTLAGYTVDSVWPNYRAVHTNHYQYFYTQFTSDVRTKFVNTVESIFSTYCTNGKCSRYAHVFVHYGVVLCSCASPVVTRQAMNNQYLVTIRDTSNGAAGLVITLQVQSSSSVLSATVVVQALTVSVANVVVCLIWRQKHCPSGKQQHLRRK